MRLRLENGQKFVVLLLCGEKISRALPSPLILAVCIWRN
jgi:hypothetical protein